VKIKKILIIWKKIYKYTVLFSIFVCLFLNKKKKQFKIENKSNYYNIYIIKVKIIKISKNFKLIKIKKKKKN